MGQFGVMVGQLVGFLIMLMVGYVCVRLRFYGKTALDGMCSLLLNVLIPVLVFSNAVDGTDRSHLEANWGVMLLTAVMYGLLILTFWAFAHLLRLKGSRSHVFQASLVFGNAGFIGIPLIMALWPREGAIYVALMSIIDQTLLWTYGVWLCEPVRPAVGDAGGDLPAASRPSLGSRVLGLLRRFVNPAFIGVMIALALILLGVKVPELILKPLHTIGNMATPMSLIYLGGLFA
ncbi:AEC family transporter, partial [Bifidobacterium sp. UTBIF-78]|uniref:AEC family transporter n=1 Tax=Bifidobacterium sp. UTBIF-78 TaxID=1465263 RepID=UPI001126C7A5